MASGVELDQALDLVKDLCNADQIKQLLRRRKDNDGIRVSAENKDLLVTRNLRDAVEKKIVPLEEVWNLIRSAEENGGQHIYFSG